MNANKTIISTLAIAATALGGAHAQGMGEDGNDPLNAVVLLEVSTTAANIQRPWQELTGNSFGSGAVIGDGIILTCAHCVSDAAYIRVRKHNEDDLYHGTVAFIDHDADLALVGGRNTFFLYARGERLAQFPQEEAVDRLVAAVRAWEGPSRG